MFCSKQDMRFRSKGFSDHAMLSICKKSTSPTFLETGSKTVQFLTKGKNPTSKLQLKTHQTQKFQFITRLTTFGWKWFSWNLKYYNLKITVKSSSMSLSRRTKKFCNFFNPKSWTLRKVKPLNLVPSDPIKFISWNTIKTSILMNSAVPHLRFNKPHPSAKNSIKADLKLMIFFSYYF